MRRPSIKDPEGTLYIYWDDKEHDLVVHYPNSQDGGWSIGWFTQARLWPGLDFYDKDHGRWPWPHDDRGFVQDLIERGYDPKTIRFSVSKDPNHPRWKDKP